MPTPDERFAQLVALFKRKNAAKTAEQARKYQDKIDAHLKKYPPLGVGGCRGRD